MNSRPIIITRNNLRFKGIQAGSDNECAQAVVDLFRVIWHTK